MKIAIVGGGIAGLTTCLNLQKHIQHTSKPPNDVEITIFEAHVPGSDPKVTPSNSLSAGGGYGLAPNGMASLRRLDPELHEDILRSGFPTATTTMKSARGWTLGTMPFGDCRGKQPEATVMVLRQVVLDALAARVSKSSTVYEKIVEVSDGENHATIKSANGNVRNFDLIVGADGIWSKARKAVLLDQYDHYKPIYKKLFSVGGFVSTSCLPAPPETGPAAHSQTVMTFGPNGFFGYTPYTTGGTKATESHIRGNATLPAGASAFWWSRSEREDPQAEPDDNAVKQELREKLKDWKDPAIHRILDVTEVPLKIPTYVLPKLPTWTGQRVVLVGDAAHALPSSSGQGVSQAIEDAEALSLLLAHNLSREEDVDLAERLKRTFRQYTNIRKVHVEKILDAGNRSGDASRELGFAAEMMVYTAFWLLCKFFSGMFLKTLRNYDVVAEVEKVRSKDG